MLGRQKVPANYAVNTELCAFADRSDRLDLAIALTDTFLLIEAKIDAGEGPDQLTRYQRVAQQKASALGLASWAVVLLTKRRVPVVRPGILSFTWQEFASAVIRALADHPHRRSYGARIMMQFAEHCSTLR